MDVEELAAASSDLRVGIDTGWVLVTGMLVFSMNAGFALLESGLCRSRSTTDILARRFVAFALPSAAFWAIGRGLMFGDGNGLVASVASHLPRAAQTLTQAIGILAVGAFSVTLSAAFWYAVQLTLGLRVPEDEELEGLAAGAPSGAPTAGVYRPVAARNPLALKL